MKRLLYPLAVVGAIVVALFSVGIVLAYDGDSGHLTGGGATPTQLYVGFGATGEYTLGFSVGSFPGGTHATAPPYAVSANVSPWVSDPTITGNFTTTMSPYGFLADILQDAATAGNTPSQLVFLIVSTVIVIIISLTAGWFMRLANTNGSLFVKGSTCLAILGVYVATRWWDWWMLIFFIIFFAAFGMMSRHQSWQNG